MEKQCKLPDLVQVLSKNKISFQVLLHLIFFKIKFLFFKLKSDTKYYPYYLKQGAKSLQAHTSFKTSIISIVYCSLKVTDFSNKSLNEARKRDTHFFEGFTSAFLLEMVEVDEKTTLKKLRIVTKHCRLELSLRKT